MKNKKQNKKGYLQISTDLEVATSLVISSNCRVFNVCLLLDSSTVNLCCLSCSLILESKTRLKLKIENDSSEMNISVCKKIAKIEEANKKKHILCQCLSGNMVSFKTM